jgi:hypothetical protein
MATELILDNPKLIYMKYVALLEVCSAVPEVLSIFIPEELIHQLTFCEIESCSIHSIS